MERNTATIVTVALVAIIVIGGLVWWMLASQPSTNNSAGTTNSSNTTKSEESTGTESGSSVSPSTSPTSEQASIASQVTIQNQAFAPAKITVKKGTKVTWTNKDSVGHNVVADSAMPGGLPTDNSLLSQNESYEFTFNAVGIFSYHCQLHPFMKGTVEIVE